MECRHCQAEVTDQYCPKCGNPSLLKRIDKKYVITEFEHSFHFEKGILHTVIELLLRPGATVRNFISEDRSRLVKPITFLIITSFLYSLIDHYYHLFDQSMANLYGTDGFKKIMEMPFGGIFRWSTEHWGYGNMLQGVFLAYILKLLFRKTSYNYFEILVFVFFISGMGMLIFSLLGLIQVVSHLDLFIASAISYNIYQCWAIGQFLGDGKIGAFTKASFAFIILTFAITIIIFALTIIWLKFGAA